MLKRGKSTIIFLILFIFNSLVTANQDDQEQVIGKIIILDNQVRLEKPIKEGVGVEEGFFGKRTFTLPSQYKKPTTIEIDDKLLTGIKGYRAPSGREIPGKPQLIENIEIVEKGKKKFLKIKTKNLDYEIPPIEIIDGVNIEIEREGIDKLRIRRTLPFIERENIIERLAKEKRQMPIPRGEILVIPKDRMESILDSLENTEKPIYDSFKKYEEYFDKKYPKEKEQGLTRIKSFDIIYTPENKFLSISTSKSIRRRLFPIEVEEPSAQAQPIKITERETTMNQIRLKPTSTRGKTIPMKLQLEQQIPTPSPITKPITIASSPPLVMNTIETTKSYIASQKPITIISNPDEKDTSQIINIDPGTKIKIPTSSLTTKQDQWDPEVTSIIGLPPSLPLTPQKEEGYKEDISVAYNKALNDWQNQYKETQEKLSELDQIYRSEPQTIIEELHKQIVKVIQEKEGSAKIISDENGLKLEIKQQILELKTEDLERKNPLEKEKLVRDWLIKFNKL